MDWVQIVTAVIGGGGLIGAVSTLLITRRRAESLSVKTAEGALLVQERIVKNLEAENKRLKDESDEIKAFNEILLRTLKELKEISNPKGEQPC